MPVNLTSVNSKDAAAMGLAVSWTDCQFVMIVADKGLVSCGVIDVEVMNRFGAAIAITRGTPEKPLVTADDLLAATVAEVTDKAAEYGVQPGMTGQEALDLLGG